MFVNNSSNDYHVLSTSSMTLIFVMPCSSPNIIQFCAYFRDEETEALFCELPNYLYQIFILYYNNL